jgi:hypothetical protein
MHRAVAPDGTVSAVVGRSTQLPSTFLQSPPGHSIPLRAPGVKPSGGCVGETDEGGVSEVRLGITDDGIGGVRLAGLVCIGGTVGAPQPASTATAIERLPIAAATRTSAFRKAEPSTRGNLIPLTPMVTCRVRAITKCHDHGIAAQYDIWATSRSHTCKGHQCTLRVHNDVKRTATTVIIGHLYAQSCDHVKC